MSDKQIRELERQATIGDKDAQKRLFRARQRVGELEISVSYDGEPPNLCRGHLRVFVNGFEWDFGCQALFSEGSVSFTENWEEIVDTGPWAIIKWPKDFPNELKVAVTQSINDHIPWGCCGGCV